MKILDFRNQIIEINIRYYKKLQNVINCLKEFVKNDTAQSLK